MSRFASAALRTALSLLLFLLLPVLAIKAETKVLINEFLSINNGIIQDEDGENSDWIELYNAGEDLVNLENWSLTDDSTNLQKWLFPSVNLEAGAYLLVFASDKDRRTENEELHTNFKLASSGEFLALVEPGALVPAFAYSPAYPPQRSNVSYGIYQGQLCYLENPSPGSENLLGDQVLPPVFSKPADFYHQAFELELSVALEGQEIYYTTDGSLPNKEQAQLYTTPLSITTTTVVRAVCITEDGRLSPSVSRSFIFLEDVLRQGQQPAGYPQVWNDSTYPADYEMDAGICQHPDYENQILDALLELPSISIMLHPDSLFNLDRGIYVNSEKKGDEWERPASMEYLNPKTGESFQINAGLRINGGNSRKPGNSPKRSFRFYFRKSYGFPKLNYPIFDEETATDRFDHLILRAGYNYTWIKNGTDGQHSYAVQRPMAQYIIDPFAKETQLAMGHLAVHNRFVHLYINGLYWGVYDLNERVKSEFAEAYLGGDEEDYDVVKDLASDKDDKGIVDGIEIDDDGDGKPDRFLGRDIFNEMYGIATQVGSSPDDSNYARIISEKLLDLEGFIDYMLINFYIGNSDWDRGNWYALRHRYRPDKGFRFLCWDAETALIDVYDNKVSMRDGEPTKILAGLKNNPEFRLLFADRVYKHLFNGGLLTPEAAAARYEKLASEIEKPLIAESARWGDYRKMNNETTVVYTPNDHWKPRKESLLKDYFPQRTAILLQQLKDEGFYPSLEAPVFSKRGGEYYSRSKLGISAGAGQIYYTLDGTDPRVPIVSGVSESAIRYSDSISLDQSYILVKARVLNGSTWSALAEAAYTYRDTVTQLSGL
ncbi:MAG: chitobiase/beta-hexosaminidase C-terminal domain-containing protein, partial [Bacteroidales bacterium]|nr:chitobiase/beta-hexosaminidase C-terminal domain-containing protein [Bacteroidales bacterium]HPY58339.1 FN3 associated domain-containing protein [Bacteroidales bacterium]